MRWAPQPMPAAVAQTPVAKVAMADDKIVGELATAWAALHPDHDAAAAPAFEVRAAFLLCDCIRFLGLPPPCAEKRMGRSQLTWRFRVLFAGGAVLAGDGGAGRGRPTHRVGCGHAAAHSRGHCRNARSHDYNGNAQWRRTVHVAPRARSRGLHDAKAQAYAAQPGSRGCACADPCLDAARACSAVSCFQKPFGGSTFGSRFSWRSRRACCTICAAPPSCSTSWPTRTSLSPARRTRTGMPPTPTSLARPSRSSRPCRPRPRPPPSSASLRGRQTPPARRRGLPSLAARTAPPRPTKPFRQHGANIVIGVHVAAVRVGGMARRLMCSAVTLRQGKGV